MTSLHTLHRRIEKLTALIDQDSSNDAAALEIITRSLCNQLALIHKDGSLPVDFDQQSERIEQAITAQERAILDRFTRRYPCEGAKNALLQELEQQIQQEGDTTAA